MAPNPNSAASALQWLTLKSEERAPKNVCAVFGDEPYLRSAVLAAIVRDFQTLSESGDDFQPAEFEGATANWKNVQEEIITFSMFDSSRKLVILRDADDFVSKNKTELEAYIPEPSNNGVLVLELKMCASNTLIYKKLQEFGLLIDCRAPNAGELQKWLMQTAKSVHKHELRPDAALALVEQVGNDMGLLNQELAKLALITEKDQPIAADSVRKNSGSWRTQTVWVLVDTILDGRAADALRYLGQLLDAGEEPIVILAQLSSTLRKLALATRLYLEEEKRVPRPNILSILRTVGFPYPDRYLPRFTRLGRARGQQLLELLLQLDFNLKGGSRMPPRLLLEQFILRLAVKRQPQG